jgi:hypothetical protein
LAQSDYIKRRALCIKNYSRTQKMFFICTRCLFFSKIDCFSSYQDSYKNFGLKIISVIILIT